MIIAGFDLETTGFDGSTDRVVQSSFQVWDGLSCIADETSLVDPGIPIPNSEIHGISDVDVVGAPGELQILQSVDSLFKSCYASGIPVVIMNASFDITFYRAALRRLGIEVETEYMLIDPYVIDKHFDKYRRGKRNLSALAETYSVDIGEGFHDARFDVGVSIKVARRMLEKWGLFGKWDWLQEVQSKWHREQMNSLYDYFVKSGNPAYAEIRQGWPIQENC